MAELEPHARPLAAATAATQESIVAWAARHPLGLLALVVGAVGFVVTFMVQDPLWSMPSPRLTVPFFGAALVLAVVSIARKEGLLILPITGLALATLAIVLGWFLMMAIIVGVAALLILIMSVVM